MCSSVPFQPLIFNDLIISGITGVLEINMFIATGFDNLNTYNPHIVCDKNYVYVLNFSSPLVHSHFEKPWDV